MLGNILELLCPSIVLGHIPWYQSSWGQHGAHLGPTGPRWAPCQLLEPCYMGSSLWKPRGTIVNIILLPQVLFYCCQICFNAASFILLPRVLFYHRKFYFTAVSFILPPQVLFYCCEFCFTAASFIFTTMTLIFTTASFILPPRDLFYRREFYFHVKSQGQ